MKLRIEIAPDIVALMQAETADGEKAVSAAMREAGNSLKSAWRGQITGAGLGARLGNSIRLASFPKSGDSLNAAALVWSSAPVIIGAHDTGPLIRSKNGLWLAIPTPAAGKGAKGGRSAPGEWERSTDLRLRFIYRLGIKARPGRLCSGQPTRVRRDKRSRLGPSRAPLACRSGQERHRSFHRGLDR